jgi:hypothetical protein
MERMLALEQIKSRGLERKRTIQRERRALEEDAAKAAELHSELRLSLMDRKASGLGAAKVETDRMLRTKTKLSRIEKAQESRHDLVRTLCVLP